MDLVGIKPGEDFRKIISDRVGAADVALVVIGRKWLNAKGPRGRRLDDRDDFVRLEIAMALKREVDVIPVLVHGAKMPEKSDLPRAIAALASRQAVPLAEDHWRQDVDELIRVLEKAVKPRVPSWSVEVSEEDARSFPSLTSAEWAARMAEHGSARLAEVLAGTWHVRVIGTRGTAEGNLAINEKGPSTAEWSPPERQSRSPVGCASSLPISSSSSERSPTDSSPARTAGPSS